MFRSRYWIVAVLGFVLANTLLAESHRAADTVVLISVDGLAAFYLNDPKADLRNLRRLAKRGAAARGMVTTLPSVTWPSHVSLVTGAHPAKHGVVGNSALNRETGKTITYIGDRELTKAEAVRVPTLYDAAHRAGLKTAAIIWPACNGADTLDFMIPDANRPEVHRRWTTPGLAEELDAAGIAIYDLQKWGWSKEYSERRDEAYTQITMHLLKTHRPNLVLLHLITPDGVQHAYGPNTPEAYRAVQSVDGRIGRIEKALEEPPFAGRAALFVVSDHGFAPYDKHINVHNILDAHGITPREAVAKEEGGTVFFYIIDGNDPRRIGRRVAEALSGVEGIEGVWTTEQILQMGAADPSENPEAPHMMATCKPGYLFRSKGDSELVIEPIGSTRGAHGHDPRQAYMHAMFVAHGAGIRPGVRLDTLSNTDVAPTIARLLGIELPTADGRVVTEILAD